MSSLFPFLRRQQVGLAARKFQPPNHVLVFLVTGTDLKLSRGPPRVASLTKDAPFSSITQEISRDLGALCQEPDTKTEYIHLLYHGLQTTDFHLEDSLLLSHLLAPEEASCHAVSCSVKRLRWQKTAAGLWPTACEELRPSVLQPGNSYLRALESRSVCPCQVLSESSSPCLSHKNWGRFGRA